jgi:hypothetical protein
VLPAVEDFLEESAAPLELRIVRGGAGLGILASSDMLDANPAVRKEWDRLDSREFISEHMERLSQSATRMTVARIEAGHRIEQLKRELTQAREELAAARAEIPQSAQ